MLFITIILLIICKAFPWINENLPETFYIRLCSIILMFCAFLNINIFNYYYLGSGLSIYGGLFNITTISQFIETFIFIIGSLILIAWPTNNYNKEIYSYLNNVLEKLKGKRKRTKLIDLIILNKILSNLLNKNLSISSTFKDEEHKKDEFDFKNKNYFINYSIIILFNCLGASLLISSYDLISMYLSIELQSFSLYILSTLARESESSTSAGLKYFLLGGLSSCFILFGSGLIYAFTGLTNFESIYSLISCHISYVNFLPSGIDLSNINTLISQTIGEIDQRNDIIIELLNNKLSIDKSNLETILDVINNNYIQGFFLGLIIIFIGFLFKISAAPLHNWAPDVYNDTPTIVTIWLTIIPKISILMLLLELYTQLYLGSQIENSSINYIVHDLKFEFTNPEINNFEIHKYLNEINQNINKKDWDIIKNLLFIVSFLSLIIGSIVGLAQTKIKRLLAYSTIAHIGFILLALAINSEQSIDSFLFYIIQYTITNLNIFLIIIALSYFFNFSIFKDIKYISEFKGIFYLNPLISICFSICLFSMAGIPPLMGFFSKLFVLYSATQSGYYFLSFIGIFVSVISCVYYLKIIKIIYSEYIKPTVINTTSNEIIKNNNPINKSSIAIIQNNLSNFHSLLISTLTLLILFFIFKPSLILSSTQLLSLSLFNI